MERLERRMRRQRGTHRCGGRWGGGVGEGRSNVPLLPNTPPMEGRKKPGLRGGEEAMAAFYTRTPTEVMKGGKKRK